MEPQDFATYVASLEKRIAALEESKPSPLKLNFGITRVDGSTPSAFVETGWRPQKVTAFTAGEDDIPEISIRENGFYINARNNKKHFWIALG